MDRSVLVDSSALVAYFDRRDQYHRRADRSFRQLIRRQVSLLVAEFVVGETATYCKRLSYEACRSFLADMKAMSNSGMLTFVVPELEELSDASAVVLELQDPDFTFFDALLVAMARRRGVGRIFSYDRAFAALGLPSV